MSNLGKKFLIPFAIILAFFPLLNPLGVFTDLRLTSFDTLQVLFPRVTLEDDPVIVIDIDDESLNRLGQWPWSRNALASLTAKTQLSAVTGFDIVFAEPDRTGSKELQEMYKQEPELVRILEKTADHDETFASSIKDHGTVVLGLAPNNNKTIYYDNQKFGLVTQGDDAKQFVPQYKGLQKNIALLEDASAGLGSMSIGNNDSIVRTIPTFETINDKLIPSFPLELVRVAIGASTYQIKSSNASSEEAFGEATGINHVKLGGLVMPTNPDGSLWIYPTPSKNLNIIPAWKVLNDEYDSSYFEGKITIVGTSASGLFDLRSNAIEQNVPGVTIVAQFVQQIFSNTFLKRPDWLLGLEFLAGLVISVLMTIIIQRNGPVGGLAVFVLGNGSVVYASYYFFINHQYLVDPISPLVICLVAYLVITFFNFLFTELERSKVRTAFSQYLTPAMVEKLAQSSESLVLGGERKEMTFLFSDIRGFTAISEKYQKDPEGLTDLINQVLTVLSNEILATEGTIDKYMGDCIMAFWNAPTDQPDHRDRALQAAFAMQKALTNLNLELERSEQEMLSVGIGINSGQCIVGNMGSEDRFDYTVLGDAVNLASRLEGQCSHYGFEMILGEETAKTLQGHQIVELDMLAVKGKTEPVKIYTALENLNDSNFIKDHNQFLSFYRAQQWVEALDHIKKYQSQINEFGIYYDLFLRRIDELKENPPENDWQGVFIADFK
jgi:adenylate cyclase